MSGAARSDGAQVPPDPSIDGSRPKGDAQERIAFLPRLAPSRLMRATLRNLPGGSSPSHRGVAQVDDRWALGMKAEAGP